MKRKTPVSLLLLAVMLVVLHTTHAAPTATYPFGLSNNEASQAPLLVVVHSDSVETAEGRIHAVGNAFTDDEGRPSNPPLAREGTDGIKYRMFRFKSPAAEAVQLHFTRFALPQDAQVFVYNIAKGQQEQQVLGPLTGAGPMEHGEFWTIPLAGDELVVELQWTGDEPQPLPFDVTELGAHSKKPERVGLHKESVPKKTGKVRVGGDELTYEDVDGLAVIEGCIIIGTTADIEQNQNVDPNIAGRASLSSEQQTAQSAPRQSKFVAWVRSIFGAKPSVNRVGGATIVTSRTSVWPGGTVPYDIDPALPDQARVTGAVAHWNAKMGGVVQLVPRTNENAYVRFVRSTSAGTCSSSVGRTGYAQTVQVGDYCSTGNMIHEIGHAVGLWHEHTRNDRDNYVRILTENIDPAKTYNFNKVGTSGQGAGAYDYGSIMHYPAYGFSINGQPTIETIPPGIYIGQRSSLSTGDIGGVQQLYSGQVPAVPTIAATPSLISTTAIAGANSSLQQQFTIRNSGAQGSTLRWSATASQPWIALTPASGSLSAGASQTITVTMSAAGLAEGMHNGTITIADATASNTPQRVGVAVTIAVPKAPTVVFIAPKNNSGASGLVPLSADAADEQGIAAVAFYNNEQLIAEDGVSPYEATWDARNVLGPQVLRAVARDNGGSTGEATITVNVSAPVIDMTPPSTVNLSGAVQRKSIHLAWTPASDNNGIKEYRISRNGAQVAATTATSFQQNPGAGNWSYTVRAVDTAGNTGAPSNPVVLVIAGGAKAR